ncbi:hypothetical protein [Haloplanus sp. C73]|uniref:hypothetical protein n=1 Tax=Haloplanus sp. C73 TaxID=3421641 RepID=UPI003EBBCD35
MRRYSICLPVEMWEWENEEAIRKCNSESFSPYDFEVFGYEIDVKTSRDVSAFRPSKLVEAAITAMISALCLRAAAITLGANAAIVVVLSRVQFS